MTDFASDDELDYARQVYGDCGGLTLDEAYRRFHLPLLAPDHGDVIAGDSAAGASYGRFAVPHRSLVAFVPWSVLAASDPFNHMLDRLRTSPVNDKIAWANVDARRDRLHLTIAGLHRDADLAPVIDAVINGGSY